ncbi:MAG: hypothetical protein LC751_21005, partial [Actinobacteria bacterium]|nr:hypothetical protein [Actinomycetota bacterium]
VYPMPGQRRCHVPVGTFISKELESLRLEIIGGEFHLFTELPRRVIFSETELLVNGVLGS